ncbi:MULTISPECIES: hypothetical protein [Actinotignum]|uniref:hypothetical protein n=1 Tax=Actinotignum TaxID=1653174 RepID=UPI000B358A44|nr:MULTISPECIES: hypothetical protein [Actinotignum]MDE1559164.1 hypothetical protein [Actinotignum schaalii]MDE1664175.1 hypothetical protein [Actinotignum schaalii]MDK6373303.1 hypothetical protein [Actinotignum timonense]MDK6590774.1 hypothetical protein [Actinotignum timonense]MDK6646060.1 hypothetical protein [Actinotignum timonense]
MHSRTTGAVAALIGTLGTLGTLAACSREPRPGFDELVACTGTVTLSHLNLPDPYGVSWTVEFAEGDTATLSYNVPDVGAGLKEVYRESFPVDPQLRKEMCVQAAMTKEVETLPRGATTIWDLPPAGSGKSSDVEATALMEPVMLMVTTERLWAANEASVEYAKNR